MELTGKLNNGSAPSVSSPSSLSSPELTKELKDLYQVLSIDNRIIFRKIFMHLWNYVLSKRSFKTYSGVLYAYWIVEAGRISSGLNPSQLSVLAYLYQVTGKGKFIIHSNVVIYGRVLDHVQRPAKQNILTQLKKRGLIARSWNNPDDPYYKRSYQEHPVFIRLLPSGVALIQSIEKSLSRALFLTSFDDLTGANRKGQPFG